MGQNIWTMSSTRNIVLSTIVGQVEDISLGLGQEDEASSEECGRMQPGFTSPRGHTLGSPLEKYMWGSGGQMEDSSAARAGSWG